MGLLCFAHNKGPAKAKGSSFPKENCRFGKLKNIGVARLWGKILGKNL